VGFPQNQHTTDGAAALGLYSKVIFPSFYDCLMDKPFWAKYRQKQLASVDGEILEIGVGTGLNLPHYPENVKRITTADPNPGMNKKLQRRIDETGIEVNKQIISSESLPFDEGTFDCVVSTITLCSIFDVKRAMSELYRVLKPGGRILFLEHGISPDAKVANWQRRLNWLQRRFGDGCTLTLNVPELLSTQPFSSVEIDNFYLEETPKTHGFMYRGVATK
jgi:SAM-dependent methyltransferase